MIRKDRLTLVFLLQPDIQFVLLFVYSLVLDEFNFSKALILALPRKTPFFLVTSVELFPGPLFRKWRDLENEAMVSLNV